MKKHFQESTFTALKGLFWAVNFGWILLCHHTAYAQVTVTPGGISYATVNAAFAAINAGTHTGTISIAISANTNEPAAATPLAASGVGLANYSSVTIFPTVSGVTVSGTSSAVRAVLEFNGADNITINGNLNNGSGTSRDLTIQNKTANTNIHAVVWFQGSATTPQLGCTNINIRNTVLFGNADVSALRTSTTTYQPVLVFAGTAFPGTTSTGLNHSNITVANNEFLRGLVGMHMGNSTALTGVSITGNEVGSTDPNNAILGRGFYLNNLSGGILSQNHIFNLKNTLGATFTSGIEIAGTSSANNIIRRNHIHGIWNTSTGGWASHGIQLSGGAGHTVHNNIIYPRIVNRN